MRHAVAPLFLSALAVLLCCPNTCFAATFTLDFEDVPGGDAGPKEAKDVGIGSMEINGVRFQESADDAMYIRGPDPDVTDFTTRAIEIYLYRGLTITFPQPITNLNFQHAQMPFQNPGVITVSGTSAFFSPRHDHATFDIDFPVPVTSVHFGFVQNTFPQLIMDNLTYTTIPEPSTMGLLGLGGFAVGLLSRRQLCRQSARKPVCPKLSD
jgi:hypothetical protein